MCIVIVGKVPPKREPKQQQQTELEKEVSPDDDEAEAMASMSKSSTFFLYLFALLKKENGKQMQARDAGESIRPANTGEWVAHGTLQSVHVIRNIRCFKVEIIHIDCPVAPRGRKKTIPTLYLPTMTNRGLEHMQVSQLKKVLKFSFQH